jgi:hypothetical protein
MRSLEGETICYLVVLHGKREELAWGVFKHIIVELEGLVASLESSNG